MELLESKEPATVAGGETLMLEEGHQTQSLATIQLVPTKVFFQVLMWAVVPLAEVLREFDQYFFGR